MLKALFLLPKLVLHLVGWFVITLLAAYGGAAFLAGAIQPVVSLLRDAAQHVACLRGVAAVPATVWAAGLGTGFVWWLHTRAFVTGLPHWMRRKPASYAE